MANQSNSKIKKMLGINWFTLVLFIVLAFVFIQKDLSLNFNLNAPMKVEKVSPKKFGAPSHKVATPRKKRDGKLTEKAPSKKVAEKNEKGTSFFNFFENPFGRSKKKNDLKLELNKIDEAVKQSYLKRFAHVAVNEQEKYGIPASIILANAMLQSSSGERDIAKNYNNHFAIICGNDWNGGTISNDGKCYRVYKTAWESFRNYSQYVTSGKFAHLTKFSSTDYHAWANGLEKAHFSADSNLSKNLIWIIEKYGLDDLDR